MKVSHYVIISRVSESESMLIHGYSGAIDLISNSLADFLLSAKTRGTVSRAEVEGCEPGTYDSLVERGYLTDKTLDEEYAYVARLASALHRKDMLIGLGYTVVVTYDCNFRCPYCFERTNPEYGKAGHVMSRECADKMFETIDAIERTRVTKGKTLTLFGGEPLLKDNVEIVTYIVGEARKRNLVVDAVTNGYDLDSYEGLLGSAGIEFVQITMDGMPETHNGKRVHRDGVPTFDKIVKNIGLALSSGVKIAVRFNADKMNYSDVFALKGYFDNCGFLGNPNFSFSPSLLINHDKSDEGSSASFFTDNEFVELYRRNSEEFSINDYSTYALLVRSIKTQKPLPYKAIFCGSQKGGVVFDPFYGLYPCWEIVGMNEYKIGTYRNGQPEWIEPAYSDWNGHDVTCYDECRRCNCALLCGGGCRAHNLNGHRCSHIKQLIDIAAKRAYKLLQVKEAS